MSKSLFHISQEYLQLANILEENGGELTPEIEEMLNSNKSELQVKATNIAFVIRQFRLEQDMVKSEIDRLTALLKSKQNAEERLKSYLKANMEATGTFDIKGDLIHIFLRNNAKAVQIIDERSIPKKYINKKIVTSPDKKAIKEAIDSGQKVKGVELTQSKSVIIK